MRYAIIWAAILLLCGFQASELRWPSPTTITLRFMAYGMPDGMYEAAVAAAAMWRSPSLEIRIVPEGYGGKTNGRIVFGAATLSAGAATVNLTNNAIFTGSGSFLCTCTDSTAANACKGVNNSGTQIALTGTGTDVINFICVGN